MPLNFADSSTGERIGSTVLARNILLAATSEVDPELNKKIQQVKNWRKDYLGIYRELAKTEFYQEQNGLEIARLGLDQLAKSIHDDHGRDLNQIVEAGWVGAAQVETFIISGVGPAQPLSVTGIASLTDAAQIWSHEHLAEPGLIGAFKFLDAHKKLPIAMDLLIALAGGAEYSPSKNWLTVGGTVAVVARNNSERWLDLITHARNSGGTLLVPVLKNRVPESAISLTDEAIAQNAGLDICSWSVCVCAWGKTYSCAGSSRCVGGKDLREAPGESCGTGLACHTNRFNCRSRRSVTGFARQVCGTHTCN
jgi:hypothetical protein